MKETDARPARGAGLFEALQLPDDLRKGNILVTLHGQERIWVENFKGISSYTREEIRLLTRKSPVLITGRRLEIVSYTREEIEIAGWIQSVSFPSDQAL